MLLKRIYTPSESEGAPPALDYVALADTGTHAEQNFSIQLVTKGLTEGWMLIEGDRLLLDVEPEVLEYRIVRHPGRYCTLCKQKLEGDESGALARLHVASQHPGQPLGSYEYLRHFECVLNAEQHARFQYKGPQTRRAFHLREGSAHG